MGKTADVFELRIREPELDSRCIVRIRGNSWHSATYVGDDVFLFHDGLQFDASLITRFKPNSFLMRSIERPGLYVSNRSSSARADRGDVELLVVVMILKGTDLIAERTIRRTDKIPAPAGWCIDGAGRRAPAQLSGRIDARRNRRRKYIPRPSFSSGGTRFS